MKKLKAKKPQTAAADMKKDAKNGFTEGGRADMKLDMLLKPKTVAKPTEKYAKNPNPFK